MPLVLYISFTGSKIRSDLSERNMLKLYLLSSFLEIKSLKSQINVDTTWF